MRLPRSFSHLFPDVDLAVIDPDRDPGSVLTRALEHGRMAEVAWCVRHYGLERIHAFLRESGVSSLSPKTIALWRLVLAARNEKWATSRRSRLRKLAPWPA